MRIRILLELSKIRISLLVTITTVFGYILSNKSLDMAILLPSFGLFLLACSSSVVNHYQEMKTDALMTRTKDRPLPTGKVSVFSALLYAFALCISGCFLLLYFGSLEVLTLSLTAFIWYNGIYTPLKKKTSLAVVPGSIIGAIPPLVGWFLGGGELFTSQAVVILYFFFIWQIPHFWLLLILHSKEYEQAGFPTLLDLFSREQISRLTFIWIVVTSLSILLFPLFSLSNYMFTKMILLLLAFYLIYISYSALKSDLRILRRMEQADQIPQAKGIRKAFYSINFFMLLSVFVLSIDNLMKM